jgi:hypothetical protein
MPGTHAQNVRWAALDEQLPPARTGVALALAEALAEVLAEALAEVLADAVPVAPPVVLEPPLLHAASRVTAATPVTQPTANLVVLLGGFPFDNMSGLLRLLLSSLASVLGDANGR